MTPRHAHALWYALPDPDLAPKESDDISTIPVF